MNDQIHGLLDGDYTTYLSDDTVENKNGLCNGTKLVISGMRIIRRRTDTVRMSTSSSAMLGTTEARCKFLLQRRYLANGRGSSYKAPVPSQGPQSVQRPV
nr:unnamed protein product [Callosobruchus analis]